MYSSTSAHLARTNCLASGVKNMNARNATNPSWLMRLRFLRPLRFVLPLVIACLGAKPRRAFLVGDLMNSPFTLESIPEAPVITLPQL